MNSADPYIECLDDAVRANIMEGSEVLNSQFKYCQMDKCIEKVNKGMLPDILIAIRKRIGIDWPDIKFMVCGI